MQFTYLSLLHFPDSTRTFSPKSPFLEGLIVSSLHPQSGYPYGFSKARAYQESWQSCLRLSKLLGRGQVKRLKCPLSNLRCEFFPKARLGKGAVGPQ